MKMGIKEIVPLFLITLHYTIMAVYVHNKKCKLSTLLCLNYNVEIKLHRTYV